jgi:hypothetical protein
LSSEGSASSSSSIGAFVTGTSWISSDMIISCLTVCVTPLRGTGLRVVGCGWFWNTFIILASTLQAIKNALPLGRAFDFLLHHRPELTPKAHRRVPMHAPRLSQGVWVIFCYLERNFFALLTDNNFIGEIFFPYSISFKTHSSKSLILSSIAHFRR